MPDFPVLRNIDPIVLSPAAPQSLGYALNAMGLGAASVTWPTANKALTVPFSVFSPITIVKMFVINGAAVSGNIDVGIYSKASQKLVSSGSTAQAGTSAIQEFNITDTLLMPGMYFFAVALDNTTGTLEMWNPNAAIGKSLGVFEQSSAFPLPSTLTLVTNTAARIPCVFATQRTVV
jgi:hypothetical protein